MVVQVVLEKMMMESLWVLLLMVMLGLTRKTSSGYPSVSAVAGGSALEMWLVVVLPCL